MITDLVNQTKVEEVVPVEWEPSNVVNCYQEKGDPLERGNHEDCY